MKHSILVTILSFLSLSLLGQPQIVTGQPLAPQLKQQANLRTGAEQPGRYLPLLRGKQVGLIVNQTSVAGDEHLVDLLLRNEINVRAVFAPEHGFRGDAANGETVVGGRDPKTGLTVHSLYGKTKKPTPDMLKDIDVLVFDIQDVGARFYTYLSTMYYVMEAAVEQNIEVLVLDRPNPNGFYVDGPVLDEKFKSFVGIIPIPVVHGMTLGELARMINGEKWLKNGMQCALTVVPCSDYAHDVEYHLPIDPSPNLTSMSAIYLYPSLCFFEPTKISIGRGTDFPFECMGYPGNKLGSFTFTPEHRPGKANHPDYEGKVCTGMHVGEFGSFYFRFYGRLYLPYLLEMYAEYPDKEAFFTNPEFFDKLAGTDQLRKAIIAGKTEEQIRAEWQPALDTFKAKRKKYLLYPDPLVN